MYHKQKRGAQTRSCAPEENENFSVAELTRPLRQCARSGPLLCGQWKAKTNIETIPATNN